MKKRDYRIDYLRGLAATIVVFCHYRHALPWVHQEALHALGDIGVRVFFVISGFIIPFSLAKVDYSITTFPRFIAKRMIRLHPPFLAAVLITFVLSALASVVKGEIVGFSAAEIIRTAFFLNIPAENPVFWTLIVEFKYYLLVGISYPLLFHEKREIAIASLILAGGSLWFLTAHLSFADHLPYFLLGFAAELYRRKTAPMWFVALFTPFVMVPSVLAGATPANWASGVLAAWIIILLPPFEWRFGRRLGDVSYSLYLIHFPLGVKALNLLLPHIPSSLHVLAFIGSTLGAFASAYILFRFIEVPASRWSQQIILKRKGESQRIQVATVTSDS